MNVLSLRIVLIGFAVTLATFVLGTSSHAAQIALVPVGATVPHTLLDNDTNGLDDEIVISDTGPGVEITLDIILSDWSDSGERLRTWQAEIDSSTYDNDAGPLPDLIPLGWPSNPALGAFIDTTRPDWVFDGFTAISALNTASLNYLYGATVLFGNGPLYEGTPKYGGTLILMVPAGATGTFEVGFGLQSFMQDTNSQPIEPLLLIPADITVVPDTAVPEPTTLLLLGLGLAGLGFAGKKRR